MLRLSRRSGPVRGVVSSYLRASSGASSQITEESPRKKSSPSKSLIKDYLELSKYKLGALVVVTSGAGFICSGVLPINITTMITTCIGTGLCAASAGTFNQIIEIDRDKNMHRTKNRPLPAGRVSPLAAKSWGLLTGVAGTTLLYTLVNPTVAYLGAANLILYAAPYTYSKQYTELNTWLGAFVGAIPPLMGWAAATGGVFFEPEPMGLATLLYLWQFPHFFALSWLYREDYSRGKFQMIACNDPDGSRSAKLVFKYSAYMSLFPLITSITGLTSYMYAVEGTLLNAYLLYTSKKFYDNHSNANAKRVFFTSLWYLPVLLLGYMFHSRTWNKVKREDGEPIFQLDWVS